MHAILPLLLNIACIRITWLSRTPFLAFHAALLVILSGPHLFHSLTSNASYTELETSIQTSLLFTSYLIVGAFLNKFKPKTPQTIPSPLHTEIAKNKSDLLIASSCTIGSILLILYSFDFKIMEAVLLNWAEIRTTESKSLLLATYLTLPGSALLILAVKTRSPTNAIISLIYIALTTTALKSRAYTVAILFPTALYFLLYETKSRKSIAISAALCVLLIVIYAFTRLIRLSGNITTLDSDQNRTYATGELELINNLYYLIENSVPTDLMANGIRLLLTPIPSQLHPFPKPSDPSMTLWDAKIGITGIGGSLHPTAVGDAILNLGTFGPVVYGSFYALTFFILEASLRTLKKGRTLLFCTYCTAALYWARGSFFNGAILLIFSIIIIYTLLLFAKVSPRLK